MEIGTFFQLSRKHNWKDIHWEILPKKITTEQMDLRLHFRIWGESPMLLRLGWKCGENQCFHKQLSENLYFQIRKQWTDYSEYKNLWGEPCTKRLGF